MLYYYYFFIISAYNEITSFIETNYGDHNFIHITNKVAYRACRARRDKLVALAVQHARHSTYEFFLYQNAWASRDVS